MSKRGNTVASAYVNLIPSAEGFSDGIKKAIDEGSASGSKSAVSALGNIGMGFAQGIGQAAFGAVTELGSKAVDVAKASISSYAEYEQLIGGVETLFGHAAKYVEDYADNAYKSAGISANEYMSTVNSMAAALNQATGSEWQSAKLANQAVIDMADNANKMGTSMELIQNAYNGFSKQNFMMLDNLKIGYQGTKSEMERLLVDATKLSGIEYDINSYADIVSAIHVIQEEMGVAGTTQKEATETISGSLAMVQGAWTNLISGLANEDADIGNLFEKLLNSIFGEDGQGGFIGNIMPRIEQALKGITEFIKIGAQRLPEIASTILPDLVKSFMDVIMSIFENLTSNSDEIIGNLGELFGILVENALVLVKTLITTLPTILEVAITLITTLAEGISEALPELIPTAVNIIMELVHVLLRNLDKIIGAALDIIGALVTGVFDALPRLDTASYEIIFELVGAIIRSLPKIIETAIVVITEFCDYLVEEGISLVNGDTLGRLLDALVDVWKTIDWAEIGKSIIQGIVEGITKWWDTLEQSVFNIADGIKNAFTMKLDIHSPSKVFENYGEMIDQGLAIGMSSGASEKATLDLANDVTSNFNPSVAGAGGDIIIPVYIGNELLQTLVVDSLSIANYRSGGR